MCFLRLPKTDCVQSLHKTKQREQETENLCWLSSHNTVTYKLPQPPSPSPPPHTFVSSSPLFLPSLQITHIWRFEPRSLENSFCFVNISKFHADVESQTLCVCNKVSVQVFQCQARHLEGAARYAKYARESQAKCSKGGEGVR